VRYRAKFVCADAACDTVHDMTILDWGVYVLSWKRYLERGRPQAEKDVVDKLMQYTDESKRDAYFFLGNAMAHPTSFMVVGIFHPPLPKKKPGPEQLSLL
jgi:hypothetical protein